MKKFFTSFKSVVAAVVMASMTLAASCSYDDTGVKNELEQIKQDLTALTERVAALEKRLGEEVASLTELIEGKVVVTEVTTDAEGNTILKLSDGKEITVLAGCDCEPATPCTCDPLDYRVVDGVLEVSADGENWIPVQVAPECVVAEVTVNDDNTVTIKLANGEEFTVVKADLIEFNTTRGQLYVKPGEVKEITFTINDAVADVNVMNQPLGWKAEIALAENNEDGDDNLDDNMGVLAAGGTEFVLKITGPSQELVDANIAEETGFISVHFNSEAGACKVGKIAVEMAKITLDVDKAGVVTVTSTLVDSYLYSSWEGDQMITEFNNYYVAIMDIADYNEDLSQIYNPSSWEFNVPYVGGWINNFYYNVNEEFNTTDKGTYVEGENEKWTFQASLEDIIAVLDWGGTLSYEGNSFMVVIIPTDPQKYGELLLDQALAAPFKQLNVKAEVAETAWNDVYLNATLRGANAYQFNINNKAELQSQIDNGWYDGFEGYYNDYIFYWQNYGSSFGSHRVATDVVAEGISFNELINYGEEYPNLYELSPNTTYIVAILAEEDGKTDYSYEDLIFIEFTTADVTPAATDFEYTITRDDEQCTYFKIFADVTVPETAVAVYSAWSDEEILEDVKDYLINNGWCKIDFSAGYSYELNTTANQAGDEKYLYIMIVDAEGNYSIGSALLASEQVIVNENVELTIENVEFLTEGGVANVTLGGLDGVEFTKIQAYVCATDGYSYYLRTEEDLQDLAYGTDYLYKQYTENPFLVAQTGDYKYVAEEGKTYIVAAAVQFADGTVSNVAYEEIAFGGADEEGLVFTSAKYAGDVYGSKQLTFTTADGFSVNYGLNTNGNNYLVEKFYNYEYASDYVNDYQGNVTMNGSSWEGFDLAWAIFTMDVKIVDGQYNIALKVTHDAQVAQGTFVGDIEGFDYPTVATEDSAVAVLNTETTFNGFNPYDVTFNFATGEEVTLRFNTSGKNYIHVGDWQSDDWQATHYISDVKLVGGNPGLNSCNVAYENDEYTITMSMYDWDNSKNVDLTYVGAIEGLVAPEACDCGGGSSDGEPIVFTSASARVSSSSWTDCYVDFYYDTNKRLQINFYNVAPSYSSNYLCVGTYVMGGNTGACIYTAPYTALYVDETKYSDTVEATVTIGYENDQYIFDIYCVQGDGEVIAGTYTGAVEGLVGSVIPGDPIDVEIVKVTCSYASETYQETELVFYFNNEEGVTKMFTIDFSACPITGGSYSTSDYSLLPNYCKFDGAQMKSANVEVTDNGDNTFTFVGTFVDANGQEYNFTWTGEIPEY